MVWVFKPLLASVVSHGSFDQGGQAEGLEIPQKIKPEHAG